MMREAQAGQRWIPLEAEGVERAWLDYFDSQEGAWQDTFGNLKYMKITLVSISLYYSTIVCEI